MTATALFDPVEVKRALALMHEPGSVFEVRALESKSGKDWNACTYRGYFDSHDAVVKSLRDMLCWTACYITLNPCKPALLARAANRLAKETKKGTATSDKDIVVRRRLLIDCDAERCSGISSTDDEHEFAIQKAREIFAYLRNLGWPEPIVGDSGNGGHLIFAIDLPTDDESLVQRVLEALNLRFGDSVVKIDGSVFNHARITKLFGTLTCKGDSTPDRPHRMSKVLWAPEQLGTVTREQLESLAASAPPKAVPKRENHSQGTGIAFDIEGFIERNSLELDGPDPWEGGRKWTFRTSPMCDHHGDGPYLAQHASGALSAGCHHDSCGWGWQELKARFPYSKPSNYSASAATNAGQVSVPSKPNASPAPVPAVRRQTLAAATVSYLETIRAGEPNLVRTGLPDLDEGLGGGIEYGEMVVLAAQPSMGKSAVAMQFAHNWTADDIPTLMISEEMSARALAKRTLLYASEIPLRDWEDSLDDLIVEAGEFMGKRADCHIVESCGTTAAAIAEIERHVTDHGVRAVIIDYAQLLKSPGNSRYDQVTNTSIALRQAASEFKIVLLVLAQLNREIEKRTTYQPKLSDIRESGQLEQDADVILFPVWSWRVQPEKYKKHEYKFYVAKNRNREIVNRVVDCRFDPSRQMMSSLRVEDMPNYEPAFADYDSDKWRD